MTIDGLRVVVVEDHPVFRVGLRTLLEDLGVDVVGEAGDGEEGVALTLRHAPDLVLMDLQMPGAGGLAAIRTLMSRRPATRILVLTMVDDDGAIQAAIRAGAQGYLLKGAGLEEIGGALTAAASGHGVYGPDVVARLRGYLSSDRAVPFPELSAREVQVLEEMAGGAGNAEIARRLFLSDKTVRNYVSSIFTKLDVTSRPAAIVKAREAGLGETPDADRRT